MDRSADGAERAWKMMKDIDYCMLVTRDGDRISSRPMSTIVRRDEHAIYVLTEADNQSAREIEADGRVLLAYANGSSQFVSTQAEGAIVRNEALVKGLWNPGAQAFWPEGPEKANVVALRLTPTEAEIWDGPTGLVAGIKFAAALATGSTPDMGDNRQVRL